MLEMSYKTKGNAIPKGKPRVFFTCHPADLQYSLDKLCSDIFQTQNCAVYYTEDMDKIVRTRYRQGGRTAEADFVYKT